MATIYRFIVEEKGRKARVGEPKTEKTTAKKGRWVSLLGGEKGGVEHNRKLRAINPVLNKITRGYWEKGMRVGRAGAGLITRNTETGAFGISGTALTILISFALITLMKWLGFEQQKAERANMQNFKQLENGYGAVHGNFNVAVNVMTGRKTFNENK